MNIEKRFSDFKLKNEWRIDWVNSFSKDEFIKLNNGHNMWIEGFMGGRFEDENFIIQCRENEDYNFFIEVFGKYFENTDDEVKSNMCDLLHTSFMCQYDRTMFEYELDEFKDVEFEDETEKFKCFNSTIDNLLNDCDIDVN